MAIKFVKREGGLITTSSDRPQPDMIESIDTSAQEWIDFENKTGSYAVVEVEPEFGTPEYWVKKIPYEQFIAAYMKSEVDADTTDLDDLKATYTADKTTLQS